MEVAGGGRRLPAPQVPFLSGACTNNPASVRAVSTRGWGERAPPRCAGAGRPRRSTPPHCPQRSGEAGLPEEGPPRHSPGGLALAQSSPSWCPQACECGRVWQAIRRVQPHALVRPECCVQGTLPQSLKSCHCPTLRSCPRLGLRSGFRFCHLSQTSRALNPSHVLRDSRMILLVNVLP